MIFKQVKAERGDNFSYIVGDEEAGEVAIIDPSFNGEQIIRLCEGKNLKVRYVVNTHSHNDHVQDNEVVATRFDAKVVAYKNTGIQRDLSVDERDVLTVGRVALRVIHTPGHTPDSICLLVNGKVLTGDTLFVGECGRTDFPGGSSEELYQSLFGKLMRLSDDVEVYPGHDYGAKPWSTIGLEKRTNYILEKRTLEEFIEFMKT